MFGLLSANNLRGEQNRNVRRINTANRIGLSSSFLWNAASVVLKVHSEIEEPYIRNGIDMVVEPPDTWCFAGTREDEFPVSAAHSLQMRSGKWGTQSTEQRALEFGSKQSVS